MESPPAAAAAAARLRLRLRLRLHCSCNYHAPMLLAVCCWFLFIEQGVVAAANSKNKCSTENVVITLHGKAPISQVNHDYICATLDWWPQDKCDYGTCSWGKASLLNLDLTNVILRNAVRAFSPLKIRLGGTLQDVVVYSIGHPLEPCIPFTKNMSTPFTFSGGCLPMSRWDALNHFFKDTGALVVFGLNAMYGRSKVDGVYGPWDSTNARDLIYYSVQHGYTIHAWELGNELTRIIPAWQYAADVKELHDIVKEIYGSHSSLPVVVAPDGFFDQDWYQEFLQESGRGVVNVITHHTYNLGPGSATDLMQKILNFTQLDLELSTFRSIRDTLQQYGPWARSWVGEAGGAYNSGRHLVTDSFVFNFWYVDQLGMAATFGTTSYCRQSLIGGNYGLLSTTFRPNPTYYSALLWHRLMGRKVLATHTSGPPHLRAYAHCSKHADEGFTMVFLNLNNKTQYSISLNIKPHYVWEMSGVNIIFSAPWTPRQEYHLTAMNGDIQSQAVLLNGKPLVVRAGGRIPRLHPRTVKADSRVVVKPLSLAFVFVPAKIHACS